MLTFAIGVVATVIWLKYNSVSDSYNEVIFSETYDEVNLAEIPFLQYCDLKNNPQKYNGKIVRVNAKLSWFMHGYFFADTNCSAEDDSAKAAISYYEPHSEVLHKELEKYRQPKQMWEPLRVTVVGSFKYERTRGYSDGIEDRTPLHFQIYKIESAAK